MSEKRKLYWDTNCFIAYLSAGHPDEAHRAADAIHAASAIERKCDCIQTFDGDYNAIAHLISIEEPTQLSAQGKLALPTR